MKTPKKHTPKFPYIFSSLKGIKIKGVSNWETEKCYTTRKHIDRENEKTVEVPDPWGKRGKP